jgi:hypothetical protein
MVFCGLDDDLGGGQVFDECVQGHHNKQFQTRAILHGCKKALACAAFAGFARFFAAAPRRFCVMLHARARSRCVARARCVPAL